MTGVAAASAPHSDMMEFGRLAGLCAFGAAGLGLAYSVTFVAIVRGADGAIAPINAVSLTAGGLAAVVVAVGLYTRLRAADPPLALLGAVFGVLAGMGSAIHGAYDLAANLHPVDAIELNQVDPRGFLTFAVAGLATATFTALIARDRSWPRAVVPLGYATAALLEVVYLGRLILLEPTEPVLLGAAALTGLVAVPFWYVRVGLALRASAPRP